MTSKEVANSTGDSLTDWKQSIRKELGNFERLEGHAVATPEERSGQQGSVLPCKMVFVRKFLTPQQMQEPETN
eukprot:3249521-Prorocentrum_lima.AAC.1